MCEGSSCLFEADRYNSRMRNPLLLLSLVVFILAGAAAYYWNKAENLETKPPIVVEAEPQEEEDHSSYATEDWKTWTDSFVSRGVTETYTLKYPRDFDILMGDEARGGFLENPKVTLAFPRDAFQQPKSNYAEAYITLSTDATRTTEVQCYEWPESLQSLSMTRDVGGYTFRGGVGSEAAAGNLYSSKVYRTLVDRRCYEVSLTVHTGNIANYPEGIVSFDEEKAFSILDQVFTSFAVSTSTSR